MRKQQEELRRLEEALLAEEYTLPEEEELLMEEALLTDSWQEITDTDFDIYNTDDVDVDMDEYSGEVLRDRESGGFSAVLVAITLLLLAGTIVYLLKCMGVF